MSTTIAEAQSTNSIAVMPKLQGIVERLLGRVTMPVHLYTKVTCQLQKKVL